MEKISTRRGFLQSMAAAMTIVAFDPVARAWSSQPAAGFVGVPNLQGALLMDAGTKGAAAEDFGHIVHRAPWAVLVPASVQDIIKMVKFARHHGLSVAAARGIGESHSTNGQAQVEAGLVIDMSALNQIHEVNGDNALVDAGVRWHELLLQTVPMGLSPPVLTDYIELSVGGTLSVGGIGGQASRHGLQVDNVLELWVVTGKGHLVHCSPCKHAELFNAVRSGLGQFGILVKARVRLLNIPPMARVYSAVYADLGTFTSDQAMLVNDQRFDYVEGAVVPVDGGGWIYALEATKYFASGSPPDDVAMTAGLSYLPGTLTTEDKSFFDFANRLAPIFDFLKAIGAWTLPHPWLDLFVPGSEVVSFVGGTLAQMLPGEVNGPILLYPFRTEKAEAPFLMLPGDEHTFLFSILRTAVPPLPGVIANMMAQNRAIYEALRDIGGTRYPIDSVEMSQADWQAHFGAAFPDFAGAKEEFDPDHVLAPGQGIF